MVFVLIDLFPPQSSPQIDHFSSLPNELLDDIFDQAYTYSPPSHPLSKRLLPFFEQHFYRKVSISSFPRCTILHETISAQPYKGHLVAQMNLSALQDPTEANLDLLASLFSVVPNLTHLDCSLLTYLYERTPGITDSLSRLQSLTIPIRPDHRDDDQRAYLELEQLVFLQDLPEVYDLTLNSYRFYPDDTINGFEHLWLPHLHRLRIEGEGAEDHSVSFITARCPALLHLALHSTWYENLKLYGYIDSHPLSLRSLSLSIENGLVVVHDQQDSLERFTQLQSLHLGDLCYDRDVASTLLKLPLLVDIHLGQGLFEPDDFLPLVSGPTRLLFLKSIILDADFGNIGKKISAPSTKGFDTTRELQRCPIEMIDWRLPEQGEDVTFEGIGLKRLIEVGKENGVTVKGGVLTALRMVDDYHIEANNRAILFTYTHHTLDHLHEARDAASQDGVALPPPDLDSLDLDRLEIIEIVLPEQDWYMLSLRNKE